MRLLLIATSLLLLGLTGGCLKRVEKQVSGWMPGQGLPPEWPIRELTLPKDAKVFEGQVDRPPEGGTDVTVFYTAASGWDEQRQDIAAKLKLLEFRELPETTPPPTEVAAQAWCSPDGDKLVHLSYTEDPQQAELLKAPGYYTLLAKQLAEPIPVDPSWTEIP